MVLRSSTAGIPHCAAASRKAETAGESGEVDYEGPWESLDDRPCPPDNTIDGISFGAPFMLNWCNGCHGSGIPEAERQGAPLGVDFDNLDDVREHADRIWARAGDGNDTMPPTPGPSEEERRMLGEWLACGAPFQVEVD